MCILSAANLCTANLTILAFGVVVFVMIMTITVNHIFKCIVECMFFQSIANILPFTSQKRCNVK